ncbi:hypothetical protein COD18_16055 [Bacillus cereus]|nr:hypothetical protein COD18_16055 [Bacillus cereus]
MIKILIADDSPLKLQNIQNCVLDKVQITSNSVTVVSDMISAKRELKDNHFDLFIIDIQLPQRILEPPKPEGGLELLQELKRSSRYITPTNIIGLSEFDTSLVEKEFSSNLHALVKYDRSNDEWIGKLQNHIKHIITAKTTFEEQQEDYDYDLAIICALESIELEAILNLNANWEEKRFQADNTTYYVGNFQDSKQSIRVIAAAAPQMGMTAAAVLTMKIIEHFRPKYLAMSGITAGVHGEVEMGDIVIADPSWDYGSGKYKDVQGEIQFSPDPQPLRLDIDLRAAVSRLSSNDKILQGIKSAWPAPKPPTSLRAHLGAAASGAAVLAHPQIIEDIMKHNRKLKGVEMESYGVLYAASNATKPRPKAFVAKSVCDFANSEKNDMYQSYAAFTSANFIYNLALNYLDLD